MKRNIKAYDRVRAYGYANDGAGGVSFPGGDENKPDSMDVKGNIVQHRLRGIFSVICDDGVLRYYHVSQLRRLKRKAKA
jgi:hypothetical protein